MTGLHRRAALSGPEVINIDPANAGWAMSSLRVVDVAPGCDVAVATGEDEVVIVPLAGSCDLDVGNDDPASAGQAHLTGRASVFSALSDVAYAARGSSIRLRTTSGGRFAFAGARARRKHPFQHVKAGDVPVELRGAGVASRQVNNLGTPGVIDADRIIVCEVLTPAGNWSSYPPHKHDTDRPGESVLEEIYYFEVGLSPEGAPGMAYQRVYASDERPIDVLAEVRSGDVVLVPYGWHGPAMAVPGYDLYYLNVMAGPGERIWHVCDDPAHGWVRASWATDEIDARLPMTAAAPDTTGAVDSAGLEKS